MQMYKNGMILSALILTTNVQAMQAPSLCADNLIACGLVLTPAAAPLLTTLSCTNSSEVSYQLTNIGSDPVTVASFNLSPNLDNAVNNGVSLDSGPSGCSDGIILSGGGGSCQVYLNFHACSIGFLDYQLTITPDSTQRPLVWNTSTTVTNGYTHAYVVNSGNNTISYCPVNNDSTFGSGSPSTSDCTTVTNQVNQPWAMTFSQNGDYAYISNLGDNSISICPVTSPGVFGDCTTNSDSTFDQPYGLAINAVNSNTYLYVTNYASNTVSFCSINPDGSLATCTTTSSGDSTYGLTPSDIIFINSGSQALITNTSTNNVSIMLVNSDGSLSLAANRTEATLDAPMGIIIGDIFGQAYISNSGNNTVAICNGVGCTPSADNAGGQLLNPAGVFVVNNEAYFANLDTNISMGGYTITLCTIGVDGLSLTGCGPLLDQSFNMPSDVLLVP